MNSTKNHKRRSRAYRVSLSDITTSWPLHLQRLCVIVSVSEKTSRELTPHYATLRIIYTIIHTKDNMHDQIRHHLAPIPPKKTLGSEQSRNYATSQGLCIRPKGDEKIALIRLPAVLDISTCSGHSFKRKTVFLINWAYLCIELTFGSKLVLAMLNSSSSGVSIPLLQHSAASSSYSSHRRERGWISKWVSIYLYETALAYYEVDPTPSLCRRTKMWNVPKHFRNQGLHADIWQQYCHCFFLLFVFF